VKQGLLEAEELEKSVSGKLLGIGDGMSVMYLLPALSILLFVVRLLLQEGGNLRVSYYDGILDHIAYC